MGQGAVLVGAGSGLDRQWLAGVLARTTLSARQKGSWSFVRISIKIYTVRRPKSPKVSWTSTAQTLRWTLAHGVDFGQDS